ncbi:GNAT family N-acetyltransferase [Sphingobacterium hotanense]|uniref:GNAT family N-acetyltransferase n=1 Tax=Sphingobacterium hotanense TaxID=649196 RepID=UPI0011F3C84C|nr:GNAT family protein [Sphingobacterium hotanense]
MAIEFTDISDQKLLLKRLTEKDAIAFHSLYFQKDGQQSEKVESKKNSRAAFEFTENIISQCNDIFTIRTTVNPEKIIGDCALHHWDKLRNEIEIGGSLLPDYWGKGLMATAFLLLIPYPQREYAINKVVANTTAENINALKFAEKLGFRITGTMENKVLLEKDLLDFLAN